MSILFWLFVAVCLDKAQLTISAFSYGSAFCGVGTTDNVNNGIAKSPMAYRVLVPWLQGAIERICPKALPYRGVIYEVIKIALMTYMLCAVDSALGRQTALVVAALLPVTFMFDYWCWTVELAALAFALSGNLQMAVVAGVLAGLSRETAPLVALTYGLATADWNGALVIGMGTVLTLAWVRLYVGYRPLYCERFMLRQNLTALRSAFSKSAPFFMDNYLISFVLTALTIGLAANGKFGATWAIPVIVLVLGWTMAVGRETRVFAPVLLWLGMGLR